MRSRPGYTPWEHLQDKELDVKTRQRSGEYAQLLKSAGTCGTGQSGKGQAGPCSRYGLSWVAFNNHLQVETGRRTLGCLVAAAGRQALSGLNQRGLLLLPHALGPSVPNAGLCLQTRTGLAGDRPGVGRHSQGLLPANLFDFSNVSILVANSFNLTNDSVLAC